MTKEEQPTPHVADQSATNKAAQWSFYLQAAIFIAAVVIVVFAKPTTNMVGEAVREASIKYDLTKDDVFSIPDVTAVDIGVNGITFGDSLDEAIKKLGTPDALRDYPGGMVNAEFGASLQLPGTGLILQFKNDRLMRMTIKEPFNQLLVGKTKIQYTKDEVYFFFGVPEGVDFTPVSENSARVVRVLHYPKKQLDIIVHKGKMNGFSLYSDSV